MEFNKELALSLAATGIVVMLMRKVEEHYQHKRMIADLRSSIKDFRSSIKDYNIGSY